MGHSSQHEENEQRVSTQKEKPLQRKNENENKVADKPEWEAEKTTESRNEVSISQPWHLGFRVDFVRL